MKDVAQAVSRSKLSLKKEQRAALLSQVQDLFIDEERQLEQNRQDLERQHQALENEKTQMAQVKTADNDVVQLNVGGQLMATKRSTLTQAGGSYLATMFTGRWEQKLDRDEQGRVFLDYDPYLFQQILFYLRMRSIHNAPGDQPDPLPEIDQDKQHAFKKLVKYLQLEEFMGYNLAHDSSNDSLCLFD